MRSNKKKKFMTVFEAFRSFIPDYVPRDLRKNTEEIQEEDKLYAKFTSCLVERFKKDISLGRASKK